MCEKATQLDCLERRRWRHLVELYLQPASHPLKARLSEASKESFEGATLPRHFRANVEHASTPLKAVTKCRTRCVATRRK